MIIEPLSKDQIAALEDGDLKSLRLDAIQTLMFLRGECSGSPEAENNRKWLSNADALAILGVQLCAEYRRRGHRDSLLNEFHRRIRDFEASYRENHNEPKQPTFEELFK